MTQSAYNSTDPKFSFQKPDWMKDAACHDLSAIFFNTTNDNEALKRAKRICRNCPVRNECLIYALDNHEEFGIWGGLSERARRRLRKAS